MDASRWRGEKAWGAFARPECDGARRGRGIFQQENIRDGGGDARKMQGNFLVFAHASPRACPRRIGSLPHAIGGVRRGLEPLCTPHVRSGFAQRLIHTAVQNAHCGVF
ncbi:MAG: hypothetical protein CO143_01270 [Candidatus Moranbacteria bacterium CG_4_9_14_3_um_filter_45_14]|nr:MAG: hypothetical protein CO143_01270 [Candidatus Moranbacteria bacterium CG_4_9_14_3_um_filter_45_14]